MPVKVALSGVASAEPASQTPKGTRTAARILDAATTVLSRDGFGGATLGRVAEEAGIDKRGVLYHFGTRETLLVRVVQTVGERTAANIEAEFDGTVQDTGRAAGIDVLWAGITSEPQLLRAYFALVVGSAESSEVAAALRELKNTYVKLITRQFHAGPDDGSRRERDPATAPLVALALLRGLLLEWIETGDGPTIDAGLDQLGTLARG